MTLSTALDSVADGAVNPESLTDSPVKGEQELSPTSVSILASSFGTASTHPEVNKSYNFKYQDI